MEKSQLINLIQQYRDGIISESDFLLLQSYLEQEDSVEELMNIWDTIAISEPREELIDSKSDELFSEVLADERIKGPKSRKLFKPIWIALATAACVLLFLKFGLEWLNPNTPSDSFQKTAKILPGGNKAKIDLGDGRILNLDDITGDTILHFEGFSIEKNADGLLSYHVTDPSVFELLRYNTIITPPGGEYKLTLPDGTQVAINASSRLKYPVHFNEEFREVELTGEAYFDVSKKVVNGRNIPFIVNTGSQRLEVLGTQFNIRNYNEKVVTTLVEGAVKLSYPSSEAYILKPNEQAIYQEAEQSISIAAVDPFYITAWKNGSFAFGEANIYQVMDDIARWYDVEIVYQGNVENVNFSGTISRFEEIDKLLQTIEITGSVRFKKEGRRIIVMR